MQGGSVKFGVHISGWKSGACREPHTSMTHQPSGVQHVHHVIEIVVGGIGVMEGHCGEEGTQLALVKVKLLDHPTDPEQVLAQIDLCVTVRMPVCVCAFARVCIVFMVHPHKVHVGISQSPIPVSSGASVTI